MKKQTKTRAKYATKKVKQVLAKKGRKSNVDKALMSNPLFKPVAGYDLDILPARGKNAAHIPSLIKSMETMEVSKHKPIRLPASKFNEKEVNSLITTALKKFKGSKHAFVTRLIKNADGRFVEKLIFRIA